MKLEFIKDLSFFEACKCLLPVSGGSEEKEKETVTEEEPEKETEAEPEKETEEEPEQEEETEEETQEEEGESEENPDEEEEEEPRKGDSVEGVLQQVLQEIRGLKTDTQVETPKAWTLDELDQAEQRIDRGELNPRYRRFVQEKRAEIISEKTAEKHMARIEFNGKWNESRAEAKKAFKDLKNPNSELFKMAARFVSEDPAYQRYSVAAKSNPKVNPSDFGLDPDLQFKCAQRAFGALKQTESGRPRTTTRAKDGLEGGGRSVSNLKSTGRAGLDALEAKAVKTGNQNDWRNYFSARERHLKGSKK